MSILQDLCDAFEQSIRTYKNKRGNGISAERQIQIQGLRAYLNSCQNGSINALALRQTMIKRIDELSFEFIELILNVRLSQALKAVLEEPRFSEVQLVVTQYSEMQNRHQNQISQKDTQINTLTEQVENLTAKVNDLIPKLETLNSIDVLEKIDKLSQSLKIEKETTAYLKASNETLEKALLDANQNYQTLEKNHETLSKNYADLKLKYDALVAKQTPAADQNTTPNTPSYSPAFT